MRLIIICIFIDRYARDGYDLTLIGASVRQTLNAYRARRTTNNVWRALAHRFGLTSLDVNMSVNRMLQVAPHSRNGTGDAQAAIIQNGGLDEHNARRLKRGHDLDRYDGVTRLFHWVFAAGIIYASVAGYTLAQLSSGPERDFLSRLNMSIATVLIVLFPLRVCWKVVRIEPRALPGVSDVQLALARRVHILIYITIFAVLASGFLMVPNGYSFFGLVEIHTPFVKGALTDKLFVIHRASCALLAGLVVLHVLAVIKHQLIARNDVLRRML